MINVKKTKLKNNTNPSILSDCINNLQKIKLRLIMMRLKKSSVSNSHNKILSAIKIQFFCLILSIINQKTSLLVQISRKNKL